MDEIGDRGGEYGHRDVTQLDGFLHCGAAGNIGEAATCEQLLNHYNTKILAPCAPCVN